MQNDKAIEKHYTFSYCFVKKLFEMKVHWTLQIYVQIKHKLKVQINFF